MNNFKKPSSVITNILFLNSKVFYKNGGCKITLVDKFKDYESGKGKRKHPVTGKMISYTTSSRVYGGVQQKICSISFTSASSFVEVLKYTPIGFPIIGYIMGAKQKDSKNFYECLKNGFSENKNSKIEDAIYKHLANDYKKFWAALCKEYTKNESLLQLGKLEIPMYVEKKKDSTAKVEEVIDDTLFEDEFNGLDGKAKKDYARQFGVTGRSHKDLVTKLKAKNKLK